MRKPGFFVRLILCIAAIILWTAPPAGAVPLNGLVAFWRGDGDATDSSGNGHSGTLTNSASFDSGLQNQAFRLGGSDDYVDFGSPGGLLLSDTSFTISSWVNFSAASDFTNDEGIVQRYTESGGAWGLLRYRTGEFLFALDTDGTWPPTRELISTITPDLNRWYHVAAVYDHPSGYTKLYVDGSLDSSAAGSPITIYPGASTVTVGDWYRLNDATCCAATAVSGRVDEVAIYSRALSASEIAAIPEPSTALLLSLGLAGLAARRRV